MGKFYLSLTYNYCTFPVFWHIIPEITPTYSQFRKHLRSNFLAKNYKHKLYREKKLIKTPFNEKATRKILVKLTPT